jgi:hypothetical protein
MALTLLPCLLRLLVLSYCKLCPLVVKLRPFCAPQQSNDGVKFLNLWWFIVPRKLCLYSPIGELWPHGLLRYHG